MMMGGKCGAVVFFMFLYCCCDATKPINLLQPFAHHKTQVCELCDKYLTLAIDYLQDDDNQNAFLEALHMTCSHIPPPLQKQQCVSMVDHYSQLFFTRVSVIKPGQVCKKLNLCQPPPIAFHSQGNCDACRQTVSQVVTSLKDPETKLKIIRLLLKECKSLNNYQDKCKKMVFEYGPMMLADLDKFLEKKDVCSILGVCPTNHGGYIPALADS